MPEGWYYMLEDVGSAIVLKVGAANPPTIVVAKQLYQGSPVHRIDTFVETALTVE